MYVDSYNERYGLGLNYFNLMGKFGNVTGINPYNARWKLLMEADILVLPGGADVDPARYGESPEFMTQRGNYQYEWLDTYFLPEWIATGKPIIGICRGMQTLNVAMGGSLFQHIYGHTGNNDKRAQEWHEVYTDIKEGKEDYRVHGVNSFHHQCVRRLAEGFEIIGWSTANKYCPSLDRENLPDRATFPLNWEKDSKGNIIKGDGAYYYGIPEIMRHTTKPYIAVQYHPEDMNCGLFNHLVYETLANYEK
jgi:putative glutamine amidotransferase